VERTACHEASSSKYAVRTQCTLSVNYTALLNFGIISFDMQLGTYVAHHCAHCYSSDIVHCHTLVLHNTGTCC
jgi:hypothetical protein